MKKVLGSWLRLAGAVVTATLVVLAIGIAVAITNRVALGTLLAVWVTELTLPVAGVAFLVGVIFRKKRKAFRAFKLVVIMAAVLLGLAFLLGGSQAIDTAIAVSGGSFAQGFTSAAP